MITIDRWNGNSLRRYHHPSGAIIVVQANRRCQVLPAWCNHISKDVSRTNAAIYIRQARRLNQMKLA